MQTVTHTSSAYTSTLHESLYVYDLAYVHVHIYQWNKEMCCVEDVLHARLIKFKLSCTVPYCHLTNVLMSFGKKCQFIIIILLIGDLSTISMRAGEECLMPEWLYSVIVLWKRIKWLFFTSRYALYVILCKLLEKAMEKIKPFSTYRHFINCFCDPTPPYSTQTLLQRFTTGISFCIYKS